MGVGLGGRSGGAVEDIEHRGRHGLVGVGQEDGYLPHFVIAELRFEGGHAGEADAVEDLPISLAGRIIADADNLWIVVVGLKQGRRVGVHVRADGGRLIVQSMAEGAAIDVDTGARGEVGLVGLHVGADLFFLNARVERHVNDTGLIREWAIGDGHRHIAIHQVSKPDERDQHNANDEAEQESHKRLQPPSFFIVLHGARGEAKRVGMRPMDDSPVLDVREVSPHAIEGLRLRDGLDVVSRRFVASALCWWLQAGRLWFAIIDGRGVLGSVKCSAPWGEGLAAGTVVPTPGREAARGAPVVEVIQERCFLFAVFW